jgi:hypothetical protein
MDYCGLYLDFRRLWKGVGVCIVIVRRMVCRFWHIVVSSAAYLDLNSATLKLFFIEEILTGKFLVPVFKNKIV